MKCPVCSSDETTWLELVIETENLEGYEEYGCKECKSRFELGIKIGDLVYTGKNDVFPYEAQ